MEVNVETVSKAVFCEKMNVSSSYTGEIRLSFGDNAFFFDPKDAVEVWRVLKGEKEHAEVQYVRHGLFDTAGKACIKYEESDGFKWKLGFADYFCVVLDANEALALAWAIEGQVSMVIWGAVKAPGNAVPCETPKEVWVLSSRVLLTGDCAENVDSERLGGFERVFVDRESAMDNVREFLRDLVNESYPESHWENNPDLKVDDILDDIMKDRPRVLPGTQYWTYDGLSKSFEVRLSKRNVEK